MRFHIESNWDRSKGKVEPMMSKLKQKAHQSLPSFLKTMPDLGPRGKDTVSSQLSPCLVWILWPEPHLSCQSLQQSHKSYSLILIYPIITSLGLMFSLSLSLQMLLKSSTLTMYQDRSIPFAPYTVLPGTLAMLNLNVSKTWLSILMKV